MVLCYSSHMDIVEHARIFATAAHCAVGQVRKYTNEPYWHHPAEVVSILREYHNEEHTLAAAWLHDVVEDTHVTFDDIRREFGVLVADYVWHLTDPSYTGMNRAQRKAQDRVRLQNAPAVVQSIKLADLISNTKSIVEHDQKFAKTYIREKQLLIKVLSSGHTELLKRAENMVEDAIAKLFSNT